MDWQKWLDNLAEKPLPGGVAAAAMASAMGAALLVKAARVTERRRALDAAGRDQLRALAEQAGATRAGLMCLAEADERAFRAVLKDLRSQPQPARDLVWQGATEQPVRLAEASHGLLASLAPLAEVCWPPVRADLEIGRWLLEVGLRAGLRAAESNLLAWGDSPALRPLRERMNALWEETT